MTLSQLISTRRKELNLTLEELGNRIGVTRATVQRWESGNIKALKWTNALQLAKALEIDPDILRTVTPEENAATYSEEEIRLVEMFRKMSPEAKQSLMITAQALAQQFGEKYSDIQAKNA